jgi:hypothetical protein
MRSPRSLFFLSFLLVACGGGRTTRPADDLADADPAGLDDAQIRQAIDAQAGGFRNCFQQNLNETFVSGDVLLDFVVGKDGRVAQVWVARSDLGAWRVEDCLVSTARFLEFPPPQHGGKARFAFPFTWNQAGAGLAAPIEQAWGYTTLSDQRDAIRRCRQTHKFDGPFNLTVYVGRLGRVLSVGLDSTQPPGDTFPACVAQAVEGLTFPDPGQRIVKYRALVEDFPGV